MKKEGGRKKKGRKIYLVKFLNDKQEFLVAI